MLSRIEDITQHLRRVEKTCELRNIQSEFSKVTILSGTLDPYLKSLIPNYDEGTRSDPEPYSKACEMLRNLNVSNIKKTNLRTRIKKCSTT